MRVIFDKEKKEWKSCTDSLGFDPNVSVGHMLLKSMELHGSRIAQISDDTGEQLTFNELRLMTIRAAQNLHKRGHKSKQVIAVMTKNVAHAAPIAFASLCMGCPISTLDAPMEKQYIYSMLENIEPQLIFCEITIYELIIESLAELKKDVKIFTFNGTENDAEPVENLFTETGFEENFKTVDVDGINETALIMYTSGSTGPPKGVCLSHAVVLNDICEIAIQQIYHYKILFCSSLLSWISGVINLLMGTVAGSTRVITTEQFSAEMALRIIEQYKVNVIDFSAYYLVSMSKSYQLAKTDLSSIHNMFISGTKIPLRIKKEFNSLLPNGNVHNAYGLTEVGYNVSVDLPHFSGKNTVGRLAIGVTIKITDEKGNRCGVGVYGEVCIKGRFKFLGYYKNKQFTDEVVDSEGFFKTGDIGHMDEDGYLFLADRKKEVIVHSDGLVFPSEIEEVLWTFLNVKNVCVVGIECDGLSKVPAAIVVKEHDSNITEEDIHKIVRDNLAESCKLRGGVYFVDSIPLSVTGKPLRQKVKEMTKKLHKSIASN